MQLLVIRLFISKSTSCRYFSNNEKVENMTLNSCGDMQAVLRVQLFLKIETRNDCGVKCEKGHSRNDNKALVRKQ